MASDKCLVGKIFSFAACVTRILFFIVCVLIFLDQIGRIVMFFMIEVFAGELELNISRYSLLTYLDLIVMAVLALIGAHGAYTKNPKYLKIFALVVSIMAILNMLLLITAASQTEVIESGVKKFEKEMRDYADLYQFDKGPQEPNKETKIWDLCQQVLQCCGLNGPEDWFKWRPLSILPTTLPDSCCSQGPRGAFLFGTVSDKCQINDYRARKDGCVKKLTDTMAVAFLTMIHKYISHLILALIAFFLAKHCASTTGCIADTNCSTRADASNYQKFQASVHVRQAAGEPTSPAAGMYPNITGVEKGPITPPPGYASRA